GTYALKETFAVVLSQPGDYLAFLPAFSLLLRDDFGNATAIQYLGVEVDSASLPCIRNVSFLNEFKKSDVLFDYFVPQDPRALRRDDLFQRVFIPGLGYI